jgi:hypothetical protein
MKEKNEMLITCNHYLESEADELVILGNNLGAT